MTIASLEQAERRVIAGQRQIARQRKVVAGLKRRRAPGNSESLRETLRCCKHWSSPNADVADYSRLQAALTEHP
jgi:hypothetical protein